MLENQLMLTLSHWLAGEFSNQKQAIKNPKEYPHIRVFFRPLPFDFFSGIGFYSEQVYDYDLWSPYRQGIHRVIEQQNQVYIENYSLKDSILYAGAGREREILNTITPGCIERRYHCSMVFKPEGDLFRGGVEGQNCMIEKLGHQTYLVSQVELTQTTFSSLDKGLDINTHEQIWGTRTGPLKFEKCHSYAHEVP
ncbi:MAG: chromophore lyase CpcT/CpeT [Microcoleaceae cyanobacterium]